MLIIWTRAIYKSREAERYQFILIFFNISAEIFFIITESTKGFEKKISLNLMTFWSPGDELFFYKIKGFFVYYDKLLFVPEYRPLGYESVYLLLCKVADTPFHIQGDELWRSSPFVALSPAHRFTLASSFVAWWRCFAARNSSCGECGSSKKTSCEEESHTGVEWST